MLAYVLLAVAQLAGLVLIASGAPGVWVQVASLGLYGWWTRFAEIGPIPVAIMTTLALSAELVAVLAVRMKVDRAVRRRVSVAGLTGGGAGAAIGSPLPLLGSMFGALLGSFAGAALGLIGAGTSERSLAGRTGLVVGLAMRSAAGMTIAVFTLLILLR